MNELALFAGAGGGILGGHLLGWRTVCAVEWEPYPTSVLIARQNEGVLLPFPIWDDVRTFDGRPWRGVVDVVSGGFPCQDISAAGKGAGINGERSGMWAHMARIIREVGPRYCFVENSPMLTSRGLGQVLGDLAAMGYDARWGVLGAVDAGAPHKRDRIWIVGTLANAMLAGERREQRQGENEGDALADANSLRELQSKGHESDERGRLGNGGADLADADSAQCKGDERPERVAAEHADISSAGWWTTEPDMGRVAHGVAARVDRLKAIGNGQVPSVAALAWRLLN
jgi:DNA (cytosine-5)-methyltransferase 1